MSLITPGLHCRYDWVLVSWGGGTGTYADPESYVIGGPTLTTFFFLFCCCFFFFFFFLSRIQIRPISETPDDQTWMLAWKRCNFSDDPDQ